jgi:hypothetical protein
MEKITNYMEKEWNQEKTNEEEWVQIERKENEEEEEKKKKKRRRKRRRRRKEKEEEEEDKTIFCGEHCFVRVIEKCGNF